jgi:spore maturation protein CgeB
MNKQYEEAYTYASSSIAISYSHFNINRYFSDRLIRAMGSGCFTLSHHYDGIELDFEVGKHLDSFTSLAGLKEKIDYYLEHEDERNKIASEGYKHVHENFTTRNMVNDILRIYEKYKSIH